MTPIYVLELLVIFAGATYFFAAPIRWKPWIGTIVLTLGIIAMCVTKGVE